jgi:hypothetical protein
LRKYIRECQRAWSFAGIKFPAIHY